MDMNKKSVIYIAITIILLAIEVFIALFIHDRFIRPYVGDVLVMMVMYTFVRIFVPEKIKMLPWVLFAFAVIVEVAQYFRIVELLGFVENSFFSVLIGSVFDIKDIVCYAIGTMLIVIGQKIYNRYYSK
ncbi:MAG: DUF2809 domain-containing protein [Lachnospira sp.]|nr:DUF2809 domain-containing protein [Lachnospira sp.]